MGVTAWVYGEHWGDARGQAGCEVIAGRVGHKVGLRRPDLRAPQGCHTGVRVHPLFLLMNTESSIYQAQNKESHSFEDSISVANLP